MQKRAPTKAALAGMAVFALSCLGLLLWLWMSFGGAVPLEPERYRVEVGFTKAFQLPEQAPVRQAGVTIGRVAELRSEDGADRTIATLELDREYAPMHRDGRAILRTKSVGGETYVAVTLGSRGAPAIPDGGRLADSRVREMQTIEDALQIFTPRTRERFRVWQRDLGQAVGARGADLNAALAQLPALTSDVDRTLAVLDEDRASLRGLVRDSAAVFEALSGDAAALRTTVSSLDTVFTATASQDDALAQTFAELPPTLVESRATLRELASFSRAADPLVVGLRPAVEDLPPTLRDVRALAPDLRRLYQRLGPLFDAGRRGLPATSQVIDGARPVLAALGPFLQELNPVLQWLEQNQSVSSDFFTAGLSALAARLQGDRVQPSLGHYLRQIDPGGAENSIVAPVRGSTNRGNAYVNQLDVGPIWQMNEIIPTFDCRNAGGERRAGLDAPACFVQDKRFFQGREQGQYPHAEADDYSP